MYHLALPWMLLALPLPWLMYKFLPPAKSGERGVLYMPFATTLANDKQKTVALGSRWMLWLAALIWCLLVLAASAPERLDEAVELPRTGRNVMLAVDVSGSMKTPDMDATQSRDRLDVVKEVAGDFLIKREGDRVGLLLFGSQAYLQAPLTFDRKTVHTLLNESVIGIAGQETAIGDAIGLSIKRLGDAIKDDAILVLLTDGTNTTGNLKPRQAADLAARMGLKIYTIGVGAEPVTGTDIFGRPVSNFRAELDEETLQYIADKTGGRYFRATDQKGLRSIYQVVEQLEPSAGKADTLRPITALYPLPLGLALILSFVLGLPVLRDWIVQVGK